MPCRRVLGIAVGPADRVYVAGYESVHIFSQDGNHGAEIEVAVGSRGHELVLDPVARLARIFAEKEDSERAGAGSES